MGMDMYVRKKQKGLEEIEVLCFDAYYEIYEWFRKKLELDDIDLFHSYPVSRELLQDFVDTLKRVVSNHELFDELLPIPPEKEKHYRKYIDDTHFLVLKCDYEELQKELDKNEDCEYLFMAT